MIFTISLHLKKKGAAFAKLKKSNCGSRGMYYNGYQGRPFLMAYGKKNCNSNENGGGG